MCIRRILVSKARQGESPGSDKRLRLAVAGSLCDVADAARTGIPLEKQADLVRGQPVVLIKVLRR